MSKKISYHASGVNRSSADRLVGQIAKWAGGPKKDPRLVSGIGGYASVYELSSDRWIAASTDGVGTKLKLAFESGVHRTVGIDLVAMCVNDLYCVGARPIFFLDYFGTGGLKPAQAKAVLSGIVAGCAQAECLLVGGETAELPGMYAAGEYDLAGFAVGEMEPKAFLPRRKSVAAGDVILGLGSSGAHSNGFSLLRKLLPKTGAERRTRIRELLTPTRIYSRAARVLTQGSLAGSVRGLAHITGSGVLNLPRVSDQWSYRVDLTEAFRALPLWEWVARRSRLSLSELAQTFNLGVGMMIVVERSTAEALTAQLKAVGETVYPLGAVEPCASRARGSEIFVRVDDRAFARRETRIRYGRD